MTRFGGFRGFRWNQLNNGRSGSRMGNASPLSRMAGMVTPPTSQIAVNGGGGSAAPATGASRFGGGGRSPTLPPPGSPFGTGSGSSSVTQRRAASTPMRGGGIPGVQSVEPVYNANQLSAQRASRTGLFQNTATFGQTYYTDPMTGQLIPTGTQNFKGPNLGQQIEQAALADYAGAVGAQKAAQSRHQQGLDAIAEGLSGIDSSMGEVKATFEKDKGEANKYFEEAAEFFRESVSKYEDRAAKDASALRVGIDRSLQMQEEEIAGLDAPEGQKAEMLARVRGEAADRTSVAVTQSLSQANQQIAALRQGAGSGITGIATNLGQLTTAMNSLYQGTLMRANELRLSGRAQWADYLERYPGQHISILDTILAAAQGRNVPGNKGPGMRI